MRGLAVCTNLAFIGYAVVATLPPVLALHLLLLPINLWRWHEARHGLPDSAAPAPKSHDAGPDLMAYQCFPPTSPYRRST
jgi:hypothetical protein